jgi:hypothetical protein
MFKKIKQALSKVGNHFKTAVGSTYEACVERKAKAETKLDMFTARVKNCYHMSKAVLKAIFTTPASLIPVGVVALVAGVKAALISAVVLVVTLPIAVPFVCLNLDVAVDQTIAAREAKEAEAKAEEEKALEREVKMAKLNGGKQNAKANQAEANEDVSVVS